MFPNMKMEKYMQSELFGISTVKAGRLKFNAWVPRDPFYANKG